MTKNKATSIKPQKRGYIEGYYGRLLTWDDRRRIIDKLADLGMTDYFYAPKEDIHHRFQWRLAYGDDWLAEFSDFTGYAQERGITITYGIAPGLDFNFANLDQKTGDYAILLEKSQRLIQHGAHEICLLMDDIDPGFPGHSGSFDHEGDAHTSLANQLAADLDRPMTFTPRIYADDIPDDALPSPLGYLDYVAKKLDQSISVYICGSHIVAHDTRLDNTNIVKAGLAKERLIIWDNLYANDYCPRRLFLGAYSGRHQDQSILLNPTGMIETDLLLLAIMATGRDVDQWHQTCLDHDIPDAFFRVAPAFWLPPHPSLDSDIPIASVSFDNIHAALNALDSLLWSWKSPLQREWYPYLMGLKQDIQMTSGQMSNQRIDKSFPVLLSPFFKQNI